MERAKELYLKYNGNRYYMDLNGEGREFVSQRIPESRCNRSTGDKNG